MHLLGPHGNTLIRLRENIVSKKLTNEEAHRRFAEFGFEMLEEYVSNNTKVKTRCHCGKTWNTRPDDVFCGKIKSCGCSKHVSLTEIKKRLVKYNLEYVSGYTKVNSKCKIRCHCGQIKEMCLRDIFTNNTKSCGCLNRPQKHEHIYLWHWNKIQRSAKKRNYIFDIDIEYANNLFKQQNQKCALTNQTLYFATRNEDKSPTASLDRIDNTQGYVEGNVQWVHKHINRLKSDYDQQVFKQMCLAVANNMSEEEIQELQDDPNNPWKE